MNNSMNQTTVLTGVVPAWLDWIEWQDAQIKDLTTKN